MMKDEKSREQPPIKWVLLAVLCAILGFISGFGLNNDQQEFVHVTHKASQLTKDGYADMLKKSSTLSTTAADDMNVTSTKNHTKNHTSWCPTAVCENSDLCSPCQRRFLILFATGRSASTTLTYMLDSLPGVRMSGENRGTITKIQDMVDNIRLKEQFQKYGDNKRGPWGHNHVPAGAYSCVGQLMIETINPPVTVDGVLVEDDSETIVGFKTIRFLGKNETYDEKLVDFVKETFPCARILVNIRSNVADQAASREKSFNAGTDELAGLRATNDRMLNLLRLFGRDYARLLDSSSWVHKLDELNEVVEWLGFSKACHFKKLLEFNTEGDTGYSNGETSISLSPNCKYLG